jgi:hypothetical protein
MKTAWMLLLTLLVGQVCAETEREACRRLAPQYDAKQEVILKDGSRVDLLNADYAIEVDWAKKWAEGIGQSLLYAKLTGKQPAVILLMTSPKDRRFEKRCRLACEGTPIIVFTEKATKNGGRKK